VRSGEPPLKNQTIIKRRGREDGEESGFRVRGGPTSYNVRRPQYWGGRGLSGEKQGELQIIRAMKMFHET